MDETGDNGMQENVFGYKMENGRLVGDEDEVKVVQMTLDKLDQYKKHLPKELVDAVIAQYENNSDHISYEDAEKLVPLGSIIGCIAKEVNLEFGSKIVKKNMFAMIHSGEPLEEVMNYTKKELEPIVSEELFEKVQEALQMKM